jgi:hypothetical protein
MTLTTLDIALPIGLGAVFGAYRYAMRLKNGSDNAAARSAADALIGMAGLAVITFAYKFIAP